VTFRLSSLRRYYDFAVALSDCISPMFYNKDRPYLIAAKAARCAMLAALQLGPRLAAVAPRHGVALDDVEHCSCAPPTGC